MSCVDSMMATGCNNFRPNFWKPATCANCFRPRLQHASAALGPPHGRTRSLTTSHIGAQHAWSPLAADRERQHIAVGVVKPYAVVEIPEELQRRYSEPYILACKSSTAVQLSQKTDGSLPEEIMNNSSDCNDELSGIKIQRMRSVSVSVPCNNRPRIIPKRKAPLPPSHIEKPSPKKVPSPHPIRRHSAQAPTPLHPRSSTTTPIQEHTTYPGVIPSATTLVQEHTPHLRPCATTVDTKHHNKTPPPKPPRTFSTFISIAEQESLLQQLALADQEGGNQYGGSNTDRESFNLSDHCKRQPVISSVATSLPMFVSAGQLHSSIANLMVETLERIWERETEGLVHRESMWQVEWGDLELQAAGTTTTYQGIPLSIQCVSSQLEEGTEREITLSHLLAPHPHICLVRAVLSTPTPSLTTAYILRDCISGEPLSQFLPKQRQLLSPKDYTQFVLLSLVQVFSALSYLHRNGVCHRDVGLDCLHAVAHGTHWLVRLSGFHYSLHRPGPVTATSFIYSYHELKWLGGADSRLPPEIMDTPANAQTLDYSRTDCFAVGCTIYEMMGHKNPFESDPDLVYQKYMEGDLPRFTPASPLLQHLADKLLRREPLRRPDASTALLITEAQLWLPHSWLREPASEILVSHHLAYERAQLVAHFARTAPILPLILKAKFLSSCDVPELIRALSIP